MTLDVPIPPHLEQRLEDLDVAQVVEATRQAMAAVEPILDAYERVRQLRAESGKGVSRINREALDWVGDDLARLAGLVDQLQAVGR